MRLKTVTAADAKTALAEVRTSLGPDAVLVMSQPLKDGRVRVTAAIEDDDPDLDAVLGPAPVAAGEAAWFRSLADHHGIPEPLRSGLGQLTGSAGGADPLATLGQALQTRLRFKPLNPQGPASLLLSGPPGAGKTTTIAKLAAQAALAGRSVEVVSTDEARAGGLEPLRALLAPLEITPRPAPETGPIRCGREGVDLLLIDTPAVNPFRSGDVARLSQLIERSGTPPVLILPGGTDPGDAGEIAETYAALGADRMIASKLDVARRFGGLLAAADAGLALSEAGISPTVGRGLRPLTAAGLARLLLHGRSPAQGEATRASP